MGAGAGEVRDLGREGQDSSGKCGSTLDGKPCSYSVCMVGVRLQMRGRGQWSSGGRQKSSAAHRGWAPTWRCLPKLWV